MTDFTYKIANMERNTADGGVITVHWIHNGVDGEYSGSVYGSIAVEYDVNDPNFVPFEQLTEEVVVGWVKEALGEKTVNAQKEAIQGQIEDQKNPKVVSGTPWSN